LPLTWIEQQLAESDHTIEQLVQVENQQQAADQVSIGNSIGSLRALGAMDWRAFVETMSVVEQDLAGRPAWGSTAAWSSPRAIAIATSWRRSQSTAPDQSRHPRRRWRAAIELAREAALGHARRRARDACRLLSDRSRA
jgi:cyclic beta-1,2-glucan synthetase